MIYLDNASTMPMPIEVQNVIVNNINLYGNASSTHYKGLRVRQKLEDARTRIAELINAEPEEIYFTSGGSEANTQAIRTGAFEGGHIITSSFEHPSVCDAIHQFVYEENSGACVSYVQPDIIGLINPKSVESCIHNNTKLISIMIVNNEIGTLQPIQEIAEIANKHEVFMHTDAVQAMGHWKIDVKELGVDLLSASGHKFGAPIGTGFLYCKKGLKPYKLIRGGGQENDSRAGTQNVIGAMAMAKALEIACANLDTDRGSSHIREMYNEIVYHLSNIENSRINGSLIDRVPNNINVSFMGLDGEEIQSLLNERNICVSTGSACHSGDKKVSETLKAIKVPDEYVNGTIRISLSDMNTMDEVNEFIKNLKEVIEILKRY